MNSKNQDYGFSDSLLFLSFHTQDCSKRKGRWLWAFSSILLVYFPIDKIIRTLSRREDDWDISNGFCYYFLQTPQDLQSDWLKESIGLQTCQAVIKVQVFSCASVSYIKYYQSHPKIGLMWYHECIITFVVHRLCQTITRQVLRTPRKASFKSVQCVLLC